MQTRLDEQLGLWEQRRRDGISVSPEDLCAECPELLPELRARIEAILSLDALLMTVEGPAPSNCEGEEGPTRLPRSAASSVQTLSQYSLLAPHARGGLGEVLLARDEALNRNVALKRMRSPWHENASRRDRFLREAEITGQLEHPGIVPVHSIGHDAETGPYYCMRFIQGQTLQQAIRTLHQELTAGTVPLGKSRTLRQLLGRFVSVCNTIAFAHSREVIHRDLKPANVMLGDYGETWVVDWGLAKRVSGEREIPFDAEATLDLAAAVNTSSSTQGEPLTVEGSAIGTPAYMSPEQAMGQTSLVGPASDIYSLGATLYYLLTSRTPYDPRELPGFLHKIRGGDFPHPRTVRADIPRPLEAICLKAMAHAPASRYSSALELARDVENWLADEPVTVLREPWSERARRWLKRHRTLAIAAAAACLVAILGLTAVTVVSVRSNERLRVANDNESQARSAAVKSAEVATQSAVLAEQQSELALRSLQTVTFEIQRKLKNVPAAHQVRRRLLDTAIAGLQEVAASLEKRKEVNNSLLIAHRDLGDVFFEIGTDDAEGASAAASTQFRRAFDIAQELARKRPDDLDAQRELALCHQRLGDSESRSGSVDAAARQQETAWSIQQQLLAQFPRDERVKRDASVTLNRLGDLAVKAGAVDQARDYFQRSFDIRREQADRQVVDDELERDLELSLNKLGSVALRAGDSARAAERFREALPWAQRRADKFPDDFQAQRDLATSFEQLGSVAETQGDYAAAVDYFARSLEISQRQADADPANEQAQRDLLRASETIADALTSAGKPDVAEPHLRNMVAVAEKLAAADPRSNQNQRSLAVAYTTMADFLKDGTQPEESLEPYRKSLNIRRQLVARDPSDTRARSDLAVGLSGLGVGLLMGGDHKEALECFAQALDIHQERAAANPTNVVLQRNLAAYHQRIGVALRHAKLFDEASRHYQQALEIAERLGAQDPLNMQVQVMVINLCHSLGYLEQSRERFADARQHYQRGLTLARDLVQAGKLTGDDADWVKYLEDALRDAPEPEAPKEPSVP